ncbi:MAG: hypothetical protein ABIO79_05475 [Ferruginibacter sp.]
MRIYLAIIFFLISLVATAQEKKSCCCEEDRSTCPEMEQAVDVKSIAIDFKSKNIASKSVMRSVKKGDYVRVKVMNYNPMLYKVIINGTDSSVTTPVDGSILTSLFDPTGLTSIASTLIDKTGTVPIASDAVKILYDREDKEFADDGVTPIKKKCNPSRRICPIVETECPTKDSLDKKRKPIKVVDKDKCLEIFYTKVSTLILLETTDIVTLKKAIDKKLYEAIRKFSVQSELYPDCNSFKNAVTKDILSKLESEIEGFADVLNSRIEKMNIDLNDYARAIAPYKQVIEKNNSLVINDSLVKKFYAEALTVLSKYRGEVGYDKLAALMSKLEVLKLYSSCYVSLPMYVAQDVKKIDVQLIARVDSIGLPNYNTTLFLPPVQQKVWGVSSGLFVTCLKNEAYGLRTFTRTTGGVTDTLHVIESEKGDNVQIGANALAYMGWRIGSGANYLGASFGAGLSLESKPKPRVLFGISFITGEKNRIMVSIGGVGGYVKQKSSRFNTTTEYSQMPVDYMRDAMDFHGFLSLNYSFLSK